MTKSSTLSTESPNNCRSKWFGIGESCHQKLPFELWIHMKAKGSANDTDADHVENECLIPMDIGVVELVTPKASTQGTQAFGVCLTILLHGICGRFSGKPRERWLIVGWGTPPTHCVQGLLSCFDADVKCSPGIMLWRTMDLKVKTPHITNV